MSKDNQFRFIVICLSVFTLFSCKKTENNFPTPKNTVQKSISGFSKEDSLELINLIKKPSTKNHIQAMNLIFGIPKHEIKSIGVLVYDGVNELDLFGPRYVFGQTMGTRIELIATKKGNVKTAQGIEIIPDKTISSVQKLDILIIPGGFKGTIEATYDKNLHHWIKQIDKTTTYTASVCTGGWILGATGLLKGKKASTNWYREKEFLEKYGAIPANKRYTNDGKYWTSAGVTAGIDMSLAIIKDIYGARYAQAIMLNMEYDPNPPLEGGSPEKTNWSVNWMMKTMYDSGINPIIDSLEKNK